MCQGTASCDESDEEDEGGVEKDADGDNEW